MSEGQAIYLCSLSAQDLRIGNWVYDGERTQFPMQVVGFGKVDGVLLHKCNDKVKGDVRKALECVNNNIKKQ